MPTTGTPVAATGWGWNLPRHTVHSGSGSCWWITNKNWKAEV
jgi:hypothetical protein